ncbi:MAG: hypothetical protein HDT33_01145 [Clostridiales bacterium]|nr:hypothetical protein [Clostridiales bacterium]
MSSITFSEIMKFYPAHNDFVYQELKSACQGGCLIPFVGAGLSVFCGYQSWPAVLRQLTEYVFDPTTKAEVEAMISAGQLLEAAQVIQDSYRQMSKLLRKIIDYDKIKNCDHDRLCASAAYVLPYLFGSGLVMTTNFDRVLEEIYDGCRKKFGNIITPYAPDLLTQARQNNSHCLFKLHGDIGPEIHDINKLVFTQKQYDQAYVDGGRLMTELPQWFQSKKLLFLGCSLAMDRTMEVLQRATAANPGLDHYAILACPPEDIPRRHRELGELGISAIYYPDGSHEAVRVILERLLEDTDHAAYEELNRHARKTASTSSASRRFMYDADYISFVGRKDELTRLRDFCQHTEQVSWWAVTGPGGMGKSRLVYQFTNEQEAAGWTIHWLKHSDYDDLTHWMPPTDRCIVVADDVQAHIQVIGSWIASVSARLRSEKLRILLLERSGKDLASAKWAELLQSDSPYDDTISSKCYCPDFLSLGPLSDDDLKAIMMDFAKVSGKPLAGPDHANRLLQALKNIDGGLQRPMYALAITDAWCNDEDPTHWSKERILDTLINRELKFYYDRLRSLSSVSKLMQAELENLLARSCTVPVLPLDQITDAEYPKLSQKAGKLDMDLPELLRQTGAVQKIVVHIEIGTPENWAERKETVEAIFLDCPDLVKEYLVLRQAFAKGHLDLLLPENWDNNPLALLFLSRLLLDYPERLGESDEFLTKFFAGDPASEFPARIYSHLLFGVTAQLPEKSIQALNRLEKLCDRFHADEEIAVEYAQGLVNQSTEQVLEKCVRSVDKLKRLYKAFPASEALMVLYAQGLFNLTAEQALEDCAHTIDKLGLLHEQLPKSKELAVVNAQGLVNLTAKQTLRENVHNVDKLRLLHEEFPTSEELAVTYADGLFNMTTEQTLEDCVRSADQLKLLHEQFPASKELAITYGHGLINLSNKQELTDCIRSVDELRLLYEQAPDSGELAVNYAMGLFNLTIGQTAKDCALSVDELRLLHERFQANEEIALIYAQGLVNQSPKQTLEDCGRNVDRLRLLHEQFSASEALLDAYARGIVTLTAKQESKDCARSVDKLRLLHERFPTSENLAVRYGKGLVNLSVDQALEDQMSSMARLRPLREQFSESEELAVVYGQSLVNLSLAQTREADILESLNQSQKLLTQFPQSAEVQLSYAQTQFNLTLKQEGEALCRTVEQLREFLLAHPDANPKFQTALDTYLGEHPTHTERYGLLRI